MSDSLWPQGLQHTRLPCPSPSPRVSSNSFPLSQWCHPTTSSSVVPFSSSLRSFPASGSFSNIVRPKYWSFSFSVSPSNDYSGLISFRMDWFDLLVVLPTEPESVLSQSRAARPALTVRFWPWGPRATQSHGEMALHLEKIARPAVRGWRSATSGPALPEKSQATSQLRLSPASFLPGVIF